MHCNHCIHESVCWRLAIGTKTKNDCEDFIDKSFLVKVKHTEIEYCPYCGAAINKV